MSDPLSDVLNLLNVTSALSSHYEGGGQWAMRFPQYPYIKFVTLVKGEYYLRMDDSDETHHISEGDCYLMTNIAYRIASAPAKLATAIDGVDYFINNRSTDGIVRWGPSMDMLAIGSHFSFEAAHSALLLDLLPPLIHIRAASEHAAALRAVLDLLRYEIGAARPGLHLMTESLARMAFVQVLRTYAASPGRSSGWLAALGDPKICLTLNLMHAEPARRWTLSDLCTAAGMSRSSFAERFRHLVGIAPLEYLLAWRMHLARKALRDSEQLVSSLAFELGYLSESAFSSAFKRVVGESPKHYKRRLDAAAPA